MLRLIGFGPSPFARKVRIAMLEKKIPFILEEQVPWDSTTTTALYNPLQKVPILLIPKDEGSAGCTVDTENKLAQEHYKAIYESHFILEYLDLKYPHTTPLVSRDDVDASLLAKQMEVVADGVGSAMQLRYFELERAPDARSEQWLARQVRKMDSGMAALQKWVLEDEDAVLESTQTKIKSYLVGNSFGLADVAVGAVCCFIGHRIPEYGLPSKFPALWRYCENIEQRQSFKDSVPTDSLIKDKIV